jgi:hypothetical protein
MALVQSSILARVRKAFTTKRRFSAAEREGSCRFIQFERPRRLRVKFTKSTRCPSAPRGSNAFAPNRLERCPLSIRFGGFQGAILAGQRWLNRNRGSSLPRPFPWTKFRPLKETRPSICCRSIASYTRPPIFKASWQTKEYVPELTKLQIHNHNNPTVNTQ